MVTKLLRAEEVASLLGVSKSFVYKLIREGAIKSVHLGSAVRVRAADLEELVEVSVVKPQITPDPKSQRCQ